MVSEQSQGQATMTQSLTESSSNPAITTPTAPSFTLAAVNQHYGPHPISIKLEETNFLPWKKQALATIKGQKLSSFLDAQAAVPQQFATELDAAAHKVTDAYALWEQQDQFLMSWLLSSMSDGMLTIMVGYTRAAEVWSRLETFFASQTKAKVKQFKTQLRNLKKGTLKTTEYLLKVKLLVDSLFSIGSPITTADHIDAILDGLPEEYFIVSVTSRSDPYTVHEIESLLAAQEERIERYKKEQDTVTTLSANLAQTTLKNNSHLPRSSLPPLLNNPPTRGFSPNNPGRSNNGGRGFSNFCGGRGRGGRYSSSNRPQCQLCNRTGHMAWQCYHRFNQNFVSPFSQPFSQPSQFTPSPTPSSSMSAMLATPETVYDFAWYPDSGASNHFTSNMSHLNGRTPYNGTEQIYLANGTGHQSGFTSGDN